MTTKFQDASSIAPEGAVELEKEMSLEMLERSQIEELVERATKDKNPEGNYGSASDAGYADKGYQKDKKPRYPLKVNGKLNEERIRAAWNYINKEDNAASYSAEDLAKIKKAIINAWKEAIDKDGPPSAQVKDQVKKSDLEENKIEKCDDMEDTGAVKVEEWKPFGGATSVADAQKYLDAIDLTNKVYQAYSLFGAVVQNIMNSETDEMPIEDKIAALNKAVGEFKAVLTPEKLKEFSEAAREDKKELIETPKSDVVTQMVTVKSDNTEMDSVKQMIEGLQAKIAELEKARPASVPEIVPAEAPVIEKSDVLEISKEFDMSFKSALQLTGNERKAALQGIINTLGETFTKLETEISKSETVNENTGISAEEITNVVSDIVDKKMATVTAQLSALTKLLEGQQAVMKSMTNPIQQIPAGVPVQKSIQALPPMRVQTPSKGFSIKDIVKNTTVGG